MYTRVDWIIDHTIINDTFESTSPTEIVEYVVQEFLTPEGVQLGLFPREHGVEFSYIQFAWRTIREVLNAMALYTGARWHYDDHTKTLNFTQSQDVIAARFELFKEHQIAPSEQGKGEQQ